MSSIPETPGISSSFSQELRSFIMSDFPYYPVNFNELETHPEKLTKFLVYFQKITQNFETATLAGRLQHAMRMTAQKIFRKTLLEKYASGNLSKYHFLKLMCLDPKTAKKDKKRFVEALQYFEKELETASDDKSWQRARKLASWIQNSHVLKTLLPKKDYFQGLISNHDKSAIRSINRFLWGYHSPILRLSLFNPLWKKDITTSTLTEKEITILDRQFSGEPVDYNTFTCDELIAFSKKTDIYGMRDVRLTCSTTLAAKIDENTLLQIFYFALETDNLYLICHCCEKASEVEGLTLTREGHSNLTLQLTNLNENIRTILDTIFPFINHVILKRAAIKKIGSGKLQFPQTTKLTLKTKNINCANMQNISSSFPNVKTLILFENAYNNLEKKLKFPLSNWDKLELLHLTSCQDTAHPKIIFSKLKCCIKSFAQKIIASPLLFSNTGETLFVEASCPLSSIRDIEIPQKFSPFITDSLVTHLAENCENLINVNLSDCIQITDQAVISLAKNCKNLLMLRVRACQKITDQAVIALTEGCKHLHALNLNLCTKITGQAVTALSESCKHLCILDLNLCEKVTDQALIALTENSENLHILYLANCQKITDQAVIALAKNCKNLQRLSLHNCIQITDQALTAIAENCKSLCGLSLAGHKRITAQAVINLVRNCNTLQILDLRGCNGVPFELIQMIRNKIPHLTIHTNLPTAGPETQKRKREEDDNDNSDNEAKKTRLAEDAEDS